MPRSDWCQTADGVIVMAATATEGEPPQRQGALRLAGAGWLLAAIAALVWAVETAGSGEPVWHGWFNALLVLAPATVGAVLAARVPGPVGWLLLGTSVARAAGGAAGRFADTHPSATGAVWAAWVSAVLWAFGPPLLPIIGLVFPDGRPLGRLGSWGVRAGAAGVAMVALSSAFMPGRLADLSATPGPTNPLGVPALRAARPVLLTLVVTLLVGAAVLAIGTLGRRWRRGNGSDRLALAAAGTPLVLAIALAVAAEAVGVGGEGSAIAAGLVAALGVPTGVWLAVTRYRLYDLDLLLARTLAYATLVLALAMLFISVAAVGGLLIGGHAPVAVAVAAAATATAAAPARARCGSFMQRSVLGLAGDPLRAAAFVGRRLAAVGDPDLLPAAAALAVTDALRLPGVTVVLDGQPNAGPTEPGLTRPLHHHGTRVGTLSAPGPVTTAQRRALAAIGEPVAAALHAAALSDAVRQSRADLLAAVEEERRRLRRDLHDGLGPRLATLAMGLDTVQNRIARSPVEPGINVGLSRLRAQTDDMLRAVRHIVSDLRPPALDELGLTGALQQHAAEVAGPAGLLVELVAGDLGVLAAAVEVAAYRIAAEAILNAAKHSGGQHCRLTLTNDAGLRLSVTDDGRGIADHCPGGVGTQSMRERAAALGGWVAVGPADPHGTEVRAWLPAVLT